ncbi:alkanesulfonate monooxygenase SsuD/methylene tetrahydromethanopterin reductase-like flavin-dependent oxidoreductase (luciferase family) [Amycolatopsis bartoniae]|uniref:Oxidoreductase n=1 Tax=Amycolatopsis bartoniae TaxID=941986 RepID=A0A8H9IXP6_9PSEU|nr:LLM class flavin-dependent oxidoreductase [Amycolatopsis bartoniae]MBB2934872.1 alkanesulfonate monooxygenase SsuD/methylene tetrahydromethanopterin reductase-like flavin-dependent oxidoreductase (luciferase family) [Amycolatopsis bartoniae]TVT00758.1 LLM class flavin-dependent oxidoreductase [Amycolatopsis bartoniae]GHF44174.1 oxidoreductase [Amycolatopsis bartoniae]
MTERPFRFGVVGTGADVKTWTNLARRAEDLGFDTLLSPDPQLELDPFTVLPAAAAVTTRLHVGTFVAVEKFRDRRLLAWQARSLHQFTGGRFELGLGTGRPAAAAKVRELGGPWKGRFTHLAETVEFLRGQSDHPPLLLAAGGPKMLALAAKNADTVTMAWQPRTTEAEAVSYVDSLRDRNIELAANLLAVGNEPAPWLERFTGVGLAELVAAGAMTVLPGTAEEGAERLRHWRKTLGISYITVNSGFMEQFAKVIAHLK